MKNFTCKVFSKEKYIKDKTPPIALEKIYQFFFITLFEILLKSTNHVMYMNNKLLAILITLSFIVCVILATLKWMIKIKAPKVANAP